MVEGWRRGNLPSARRSNSRVWIVLTLVAVFGIIVAEVALDVVRSGTVVARASSRSYVSEVLPVIDESNALGSSVHLVRNDALSFTRASLEQALGNLVSGTAANSTELETLGVAAPSARSEVLLQEVLAKREGAVGALARAIALAIGQTARDSATSSSVLSRAAILVMQAGASMAASDLYYSEFVRSLPRSSRRGRLPVSKWLGRTSVWAQASALAWVARLSVARALQIRQRLTVLALSVEPPAVRILGLPTTTTTTSTTTTSTTTTTTIVGGKNTPKPGAKATTTTTSSTTTTTSQIPYSHSTSVLLPSNQISVVLVIANEGNTAISSIWGSAAVVPEASRTASSISGGMTRWKTVRIGRLAPGASVVVTLAGLKVAKGESYRLWASVGTGNLPTGAVTSSPGGLGQADEVNIKVSLE
jgi:hypothetical protein